MSKYQVFEISKDGKRIIESGLSLEKAESVSQEIAKPNLENVYGYEPVYVKEIVKMDKNRFETQKEVVNLDPSVHNIQSLFTVEDLKWLIEQAEKVEQLESIISIGLKRVQELEKGE